MKPQFLEEYDTGAFLSIVSSLANHSLESITSPVVCKHVTAFQYYCFSNLANYNSQLRSEFGLSCRLKMCMYTQYHPEVSYMCPVWDKTSVRKRHHWFIGRGQGHFLRDKRRGRFLAQTDPAVLTRLRVYIWRFTTSRWRLEHRKTQQPLEYFLSTVSSPDPWVGFYNESLWKGVSVCGWEAGQRLKYVCILFWVQKIGTAFDYTSSGTLTQAYAISPTAYIIYCLYIYIYIYINIFVNIC